jgi:hypothetical protein
MNFYEELGVPPDASPDTIREAYRNVARVLHPDAQINPVLKVSAEAQMKRINLVYEVLSDPERRHRYDCELTERPERVATLIIQAAVPTAQFQQVRHRETLAWLAATVICGIFIIWLATREAAAPAVYPPAQAATATAPSTSRPPASEEVVKLRGELASLYAEKQRLTTQLAILRQGGSKLQNPLPPPPPSNPTPVLLTPPPLAAVKPTSIDLALPALPVVPALKMRWAGSWMYRHDRTVNRDQSLFPPEFIETVIAEESGNLRGQYHARFKVRDAHISPEVDFRFEGKTAGLTGRFPWTGTGGATGEVQLRLISDSTLEVVWTATSLGKSMGLASGTAVLRRQN